MVETRGFNLRARISYVFALPRRLSSYSSLMAVERDRQPRARREARRSLFLPL